MANKSNFKLYIKKKQKNSSLYDTHIIDVNKIKAQIKWKGNPQLFEIEKKNVVLKFNNFSLFINGKKILNNLTFEIPEKKIIAIIGPSGSGKSCLIKSINRINEEIMAGRISYKGQILYNNQNIYDPKLSVSSLRQKIGMVFQKPSAFNMSVFDNVAYGLRINGIKKSSIIKLLVIKAIKNAGLYNEVKDNLFQNAANLSGGQQQRLCIARAICLEPEIILLDEPTSALDPHSVSKVEKLILSLCKKFTIIIITHSIRQALRIADYVMLIKNGNLIEYNNTAKIFNQPVNQITKKYIYKGYEN